MPGELWKQPVAISFQNVGSKSINGPDDAVTCLIDSWPNRRGACFIRALTACRGALAGRIDGEIARTEFVAAVHEIESA
ncbi:DUF982 domain-containing protein [Rhizobium calliandrae]|uniref:DUF982 domain-containing protein n=1 Tax=Rhizobium calliandrae TaxID=1312182 RepID=A0ABT7KJ15_9HYPH|nr:DUF982 domain-containing protein [Rhizobium calliandrae]MDL2408627.1 DUF982 domain-containing protein [Rhizobium calliandrae]